MSFSNSDIQIFYRDATELARLIRTKELSPVEVVRAHLDRVEAVNPKVNAVVTLMRDDAIKAAKTAEAAVLNGAALGPLHGVPFSIKDALDTEGDSASSGKQPARHRGRDRHGRQHGSEISGIGSSASQSA
jgi:aspartyl-tRNA(Asn)/glutamyl-tRNA(Gln) amidotransferase subunit A